MYTNKHSSLESAAGLVPHGVICFVRVAENNDLSRDLEDAQSKLTQVSRLKASLMTQIDELKRQVDEENKVTTDPRRQCRW